MLTAATPALANHDHRERSVNERQARLAQRIERGWRTGELTPHEYRRLVHEAREIERAEHFYRSDGRLSPRERSDLHARLDHLARAIHHERRDVEQRHGSYNYDHQPAYRRF
jgi:hypothetical protein